MSSETPGIPCRDADFDVLPGFQNPPAGYGEVAFYWWLGDPLTKERIAWQLDQLEGMSLSGLQINYAHTDKGGLSHGFSIPSDPPALSESWWELVRWFAAEAKRRGLAISLSDYTLGIGQGFTLDEILRDHPELRGSNLICEVMENVGKPVRIAVGRDLLSASGLRSDGKLVDLRRYLKEGLLEWNPGEGEWRILFVRRMPVTASFDAMQLGSGEVYANSFFGQFEKQRAGRGGDELNFFFSDELEFRTDRYCWNDRFAEEFFQRKGYDIIPVLPALWHDLGDITPKVRLDYNDVQVALSEEQFFKPVYEWHQKREMILGCDHWGRGRDVLAFGDYFRTQRWNQGPGCDQPKLERDLIKNKVAASIAHLYERPRVWLEGYHSSGWGTSCSEVAEATFANFAHGQNMLSFHGLYYSTHGTWWEWAPPCNHWRMPYWKQMRGFMRCVERMSYLLSQGHHKCDVAILYPVEAAAAGLGGSEAVAFESAEHLYESQFDFDFMDAQSLERAEIASGELCVSGEAYRVLVIPGMRALRMSSLRKLKAFHQAGGIVLAVEPLPEVSDRVGRNDPEVSAILGEVFSDARDVVPFPEKLVSRVAEMIDRDVSFETKLSGVQFLHRRVGSRDLYYLYGVPRGTVCRFRAVGAVELWDPWNGTMLPLSVTSQDSYSTTLLAPLEATEPQLIVFSPGSARVDAPGELTYRTIPLSGEWNCEFIPTLDNRFGDFRWPPCNRVLGPEIRRMRCSVVDSDAGSDVTVGFGVKFLQLGPLPADADCEELERALCRATSLEASRSYVLGEKSYSWKPYEFSWRWGVEGDPGHQGWHGLKEEMYDEFIRLGKLEDHNLAYVRIPEEDGSRYYLATGIFAPAEMEARILIGGMKPGGIWINGSQTGGETCQLRKGVNLVLLRYDQAGTGFFVLADEEFKMPAAVPGSLSMRWNGAAGVLPFDVRAAEEQPASSYRFKLAPGTKAFLATVRGEARCSVGGVPCEMTDNGDGRMRFSLSRSSPGEAEVALQIRHERGLYGGEAIPEAIAFECEQGTMELGDWSQLESLESYSGGIRHGREVEVPAFHTAILDLGEVVASAEVIVNGASAGSKVCGPWRFDVSTLLRTGNNRIEVVVYNTLSNHYITTPTRYRGSLRSGLIGPASLRIS